MPLWLAEIALLLGLFYGSWRIPRLGVGRVAQGLAIRAVAILASFVAAKLVGPAAGLVTHNFILQFTAAAVVCAAVYIAVATWLLRRARRAGHPWAARVDRSLPRWLARTLTGLCVVTLWLGTLLIFDATGQLLSASNWRGDAEHRTLLLRYFLDPPREAAAPSESANTQTAGAATQPADLSLQEKLDQQHRLLGGLGRGIARARGFVADATGTRRLAAQVDALKTITNLPYKDRAWILQNNPGLLALMKNPNVDRVLKSDRVFDLIDRVSAGSLAAVYELGDEPDVQRLLEDEQVRPLLGRVDPGEMVRKLEEHRRSAARPVEVRWRAARINQPTQLDAALADAAGWKESPDAATAGQRWPADTRLGVLATTLTPAGPRLLTIEIPVFSGSAAAPVVWCNGQIVSLAGGEGHWVAVLPAATETARVEIVIDFRDAASPASSDHTCRAWLAAPD